MSPRLPAKKPALATSPFRRDEVTPVHTVFEVNDRVTHDRHGLGTVKRIGGGRMEVRFRDKTVSIALPNEKVQLL